MHVVEHEPLEELRELSRRQRRAREHLRFRAVVLAREGKTAPQIAAALGCGRRPAQEWVRRYNIGGVAALAERRHTGRPPRLAAGREAELKARIDAGPTPADGTCAFHGEDVRRILEEEFGVLMKLSAVYGLLHRLGYSRLCPRPHHPRADPSAREAFKKSGRTRAGGRGGPPRPARRGVVRGRGALRPAGDAGRGCGRRRGRGPRRCGRRSTSTCGC